MDVVESIIVDLVPRIRAKYRVTRRLCTATASL